MRDGVLVPIIPRSQGGPFANSVTAMAQIGDTEPNRRDFITQAGAGFVVGCM